MNVLEKLGIVIDTNQSEVPLFKKFSGTFFFLTLPFQHHFVYDFLYLVSRIVNEVHGSATKKNMEWQEKLPIVVFRAEEIMYSKANSEVFFFFPFF